MTLRNRLTLTFLGLFCTAFLALVLLFYQVGELPRLALIENELSRKSAAIVTLQVKLGSTTETVAGRTYANETWGIMLAERISEALKPPDGFDQIDRVQPKVDRAVDAVAAAQATNFRDVAKVAALSACLGAVQLEYNRAAALLQGQTAAAGLIVIRWAAGLCILITAELGVFWLLIRRWTIYPIMSLASEANRMRAGESDVRLTIARHDELGQLAAGFNDLVARLQQHQQQLADVRRMAAVGEICSGVAHGMRNPLAVIRLTGQRLEQLGVAGSNERAMVSEIIQQVDRLDARITRLLRFGSSANLRYEPVRFGWLATAVERESHAALRERDLTLRIVDETGGRTCPLDPDLAVQATVECVSNSAIHSSVGTEIVLRCQTAGTGNGHVQEWIVSIEDRGRGIDPKVANNIFDLFFTLREEGTGIGLSMVKRILEQHRGRIEVQSKPDHGTTIRLIWPLSVDQSALAQPQDPASRLSIQVTPELDHEDSVSDAQ